MLHFDFNQKPTNWKKKQNYAYHEANMFIYLKKEQEHSVQCESIQLVVISCSLLPKELHVKT